MEQNTEAWLEWRGEALGSSDAPIILGISPYKSPYELWLEKTGRKQPDQEKFAFALGHRAEPYIRALAEKRLGEQFEPGLVRSKDYPFMQASLDGRNFSLDVLMEIKVNEADTHKLIPGKEEALPEHHYWQMQHQLLVTGGERCMYVSAPFREDFSDLVEDDLHIMTVKPAWAASQKLIRAEAEFIEHLATDTPPPLQERDGVHMRSAAWRRNAEEWSRLNEQIKKLKKKQDRVVTRLKELSVEHRVARGYGVKVTNSFVKGSIQYAKIPELENVDKEKYRAKGYIKTTVSQEN